MATNPRRGKFMSPPSSSVPTSNVNPATAATVSRATHVKNTSSSRGKFLGGGAGVTGAAASSSLPVCDGTDGENGTHTPSLSTLITQVNREKVAAMNRRSAISSQRNAVFDDLDEAEDIVLSLLDCAAEVADALSNMTTAKIGNTSSSGDTNAKKRQEATFEELSNIVSENGKDYLAGVKKLHKLLAPHASLVKSYRNHTTEAVSSSSDKQLPPPGVVSSRTPSVNADESRISKNIIKNATSNMYAARVEKRLALERSEILKEMIRLEEESCDTSDTTEKYAGGTKRKLESLDEKI